VVSTNGPVPAEPSAPASPANCLTSLADAGSRRASDGTGWFHTLLGANRRPAMGLPGTDAICAVSADAPAVAGESMLSASNTAHAAVTM
jgi:hypothetical protein